ncbi:or S-antigen, C-terminal domain-domain-containing protein [Absidia repens]|uniref:Or S-antigen, C-terminal domain-domain-containing protein n=1 Tax=Absidia repens TaxID=90262 RepID=A0A1X2IA69_9FUNG|nr:or S-antigen, C-terminal domain-domain-containing protein [Absidia repens]
MVHPIQLVQGAEFKINLESSHIILHGSVEESSGVMLRGSVVLECHETTKIRSITLKLIGKVKVNWMEGTGSHQRLYKEEQTIVEHEWSFMPQGRKTYHLSERHYQWDFELPLPGDLPETMHHDLGEVYYRLKAVAERPTFSLNYSDKRSLKVSRLMLPTSMELLQSVLISNVWADKLSYEISVPSKCYTMGSLLPVTFDFMPIAPDLKIKSIACALKEYLTLSTPEHSKTESRVVKVHRDNTYQETAQHIGDSYHKTELISIPDEASQSLMMDTANDLIKVRHKLKFTVTLINADGHISELRAAIPIIIAAISVEDDANALPAYEDAWRSMPYDPATISQLIASGALPPSLGVSIPNAAASMAHTSFSSDDGDRVENDNGSTNSENNNTSTASSTTALNIEQASDCDSPLPWQGIDLSRVPSYTTAVRSNRLYSFSGSLPTYESVSIPGRTTR